MLSLTRLFSPYQLNPFDLNPLRDVVEARFDFERIRSQCRLRLFIAATQVRTGKVRLFHTPELSADALLASACLPTLHHAVEIDGEAYWDGGFTANPAVYPLIYDCTTPDILLVLLNPLRHPDAPRSAEEIATRSMELGFSTTFLREMRTLGQARAYMQEGSGWLPGGRLERKLAGLRFHLLEAEELADAGKALAASLLDAPAHTVSAGGTTSGGAEPFANAGYRKRLAAAMATAGLLDRPATAITSRNAVAAAGHHASNWTGSVRAGVAECSALQSFPAGFAFSAFAGTTWRTLPTTVA